MKRAPFGAVVVLGAVLLAGCAGRIDSVTNVTQVAATVNSTVSCNQGEAGQVWVEYRRTAAGGAWAEAGRRSFNCPAPISVQWPLQLTGLTPGTAYQVRLCYDPVPVEGNALCVDKNGTGNGTNYATFTTTSAASSCTRNATASTFASEVSAATAGQTVCLASGNYGTFQGTNKAITIRAAAGATPTMRYQFGSGDSGFTLTGLSGMGGSISSGASNITVRASAFNSYAQFSSLSNSNILFEGNTHNYINSPSGSPNARIVLGGDPSTHSGVTIRNSVLRGGDSDGVFTGVGVNVIGNEFADICESGPNHTDMIQFAKPANPSQGAGGVIRGNYFHAGGCSTQTLASYDSGTRNVLIEDNVVDTRRPWGIELYSDEGSIVRHNTVRWYPDSECSFGGTECGYIDITRKSADPPGQGTQVYANVGMVTVQSGSTVARNDHNVDPEAVRFVGPLTSYAGFHLAAGSVGKGAAGDGSDVGIR